MAYDDERLIRASVKLDEARAASTQADILYTQAQAIRTLAEIEILPGTYRVPLELIIKAVTSNDLSLLIPNTEKETNPA